MTTSRKKFIIIFIICGFAFLFISTSLLGSTGPRGFPQAPDSVLRTGSDSPVVWKRTVSTIIMPIKIVLIGPLLLPGVHFLQEDPPPPFVGIYFIFYWTILALIIYYFVGKLRRSKSINTKIVLLDRDGTVIIDPTDERVDTEEKIKLFPDSIEALKYLALSDFEIIFVTNQAGISEGRITLEDFERINNKVLKMLAPSGTRVLKTFVCPHGSGDNCVCRKPKPKMLLDAAREFSISLTGTYMVGDRLSDINAGINAGSKTILVKTATNETVVAEQADYTAETLLDAVKYIVEHSR